MSKRCVLSCSQCGSRNYTKDKSKPSVERLEINKFCKTCNCHTVHKETK